MRPHPTRLLLGLLVAMSLAGCGGSLGTPPGTPVASEPLPAFREAASRMFGSRLMEIRTSHPETGRSTGRVVVNDTSYDRRWAYQLLVTMSADASESALLDVLIMTVAKDGTGVIHRYYWNRSDGNRQLSFGPVPGHGLIVTVGKAPRPDLDESSVAAIAARIESVDQTLVADVAAGRRETPSEKAVVLP